MSRAVKLLAPYPFLRIALVSLLSLALVACGDEPTGEEPGEGGSAASGGSSTGTGGAGAAGGSGGIGAGGAGGAAGGSQPIGPEPTGIYGIVDHDVTELPAGIGFHDQDYEYLLHVSPPATWEHAPGEAFDGRDAVRFYPHAISDGYAGPRELHFDQTLPGRTQLFVRWLVQYSDVAHQAFSGNKQLIINRTDDPLGLGGTGRSISLWRQDPVHDGMVLGPCDGIVCSYLDADPPYWPDGSDTFWVGPQSGGGHANEWICFEQEYVTDHDRVLSGSPEGTCTTVAGTDRVQFSGTVLTQDLEPYDSLTIQDGPDASRYIVREIVSDTEVRVDPAPVGAGGTASFVGGSASYRFHYAYTRLYIHTRDGSVAGEYHTVPQWDTGGFGEIYYFDILGGYFGPSQDMGDEGWFMLDRLRLDEHYIGPPDGFLE